MENRKWYQDGKTLWRFRTSSLKRNITHDYPLENGVEVSQVDPRFGTYWSWHYYNQFGYFAPGYNTTFDTLEEAKQSAEKGYQEMWKEAPDANA